MSFQGDLLTQEDWDSAPGDPKLAFVHLEQRARSTMRESVREYQNNEGIDDWRFDYISTAVSLGHAYEIEGLCDRDLPSSGDFNDADFRYYCQLISSAVTKIRAANAIHVHASTVQLGQADKKRVEHHVADIRKLINAAELEPKRKARILDKLGDFEQELIRHRVDMRKLLLFGLALTGWANDIGDFPKTLQSAYDETVAIVAKAKTAEEEHTQPLPLPAPRKLLPAPEKAQDGYGQGQRKGPARESFPADLDDEIPF